ncbi:MAG: mandelate racemase/muconate lactonizing enzyme family protein [Deltaproteobacteria bacterium]|jgi:muconate cycloisomerase|nr:mandelate racemase/muconate lactonizing enzyme family protein [Deltaproteobacteria bacterium]
MKIKQIRVSPLFMTFKEPYHWHGRIDYGTTIILFQVETEQGKIGVGESTSSLNAAGSLGLLANIIPPLIGQPLADIDRLVSRSRYLGLINDAIRMPNLLLAGLEMAMWDALAQTAGLPLYQLWGGASREHVDYFGFVQGDEAEELVRSAKELVKSGHRVIYMKVGRGEKSDLKNVQAVRKAIGSDLKLRLDANESWDVFTAKNMIKKLAQFDIEFIEQPVECRSLSALKEVKDFSPVPIAVDQGAYSLEEVFEVCSRRLADVLVLSPHETGGATNFKKAAAIGEAAKLPVCLHGQFTTRITDFFHHHLAATLPNLTDGNQIMGHLLTEDLLKSPTLALTEGRLGLPFQPGLGVVLNEEVIKKASERYAQYLGGNVKDMDFVYTYE